MLSGTTPTSGSGKWASKRTTPYSPAQRLDPLVADSRVLADGGDGGGGAGGSSKSVFLPRRVLPSLVLNFMDESGALSDTIDLEMYRKQNATHVTNAVVQELADLIPSMTSLNLARCFEVTDVGLWALSRVCTNLTNLNLEELPRVTLVGLRDISLCCKAMRTLNLAKCTAIDDAALRTVAANLWSLESLDVSYTKVSDVSVGEIASCCRHLKSLNFSGMKHVGDHGLVELSKYCTSITRLDVRDTRFVKGPGLVAVSRTCHQMLLLDLTGCQEVPAPVFFGIAEGCTDIVDLKLSGCAKLDDASLAAMVRALTNLQRLDISACPKVTRKGLMKLAQNATRLRELTLAIPTLSNDAIACLTTGCTALRSLDVTGCVLLKESGVRSLVSTLSRLTILKLNACDQVGRGFVKRLAEELPYVKNSTEFFGLVGLPDCDARIYLTELKRAQLVACAHVQRLARGMLAKRRVQAIRHNLDRTRAASAIQRVWWGHVARVRVARMLVGLSRAEATLMVQSCIRGWFGRLKVRRLRWRLAALARRNLAASTAQCAVRSYWARVERDKRMALKFLREQEERRMATRRQKAARTMQDSWMIYRARCRVAAMKEALRRERALQLRRHLAAINIQRLVRGHLGRVLLARMKEYLKRMILQAKACLYMQCAMRRFMALKETRRRRYQFAITRRWNAAVMVQKAFRGSRARHVFSMLLSMHALNAVEQAASKAIQTRFRVHKARKFLNVLKAFQEEHNALDRAATRIQKAVRGMKGRQFYEITRNIMSLHAIAGPIQHQMRHLQELQAETQRNFESISKRLTAQEEQLLTWESERKKLEGWREKTYDTDKITGTMQRFKVEFIRGALGQQMAKFHSNLKWLQGQHASLTTQLHELHRQHRLKQRELMPIENGVQAKTLEARRERYRQGKLAQGHAASKIQGLVRGRQTRRKMRLGLLPTPQVDSLQQELTAWGETVQPDVWAAWHASQDPLAYTGAGASGSDSSLALAGGYTWDGQGYSGYGQYGYGQVESSDAYWAGGQWQGDAATWYAGEQYNGEQYSSEGYADQSYAGEGYSGEGYTGGEGYTEQGYYGEPSEAGGQEGATTSARAPVLEDEGLYPLSPVTAKLRRAVATAAAKERGMLDLSPTFQPKRLHAAAGPRPEDSCVPRDEETGMPTLDIPRLLRHKLALVDRTTFPYVERRTHIGFLHKLLADKDWLRVAGIADQIVALQSQTRERLEAERIVAQAKALAIAQRAEERRRQEESLGMYVCDKESAAFEKVYEEWLRQKAAALARLELSRVTLEWLGITKEDELAKLENAEFNRVLAHERYLQELAAEKVRRLKDRVDMTAAARESRGWSDAWNVREREFIAFNKKVGEEETDAMQEEEDNSILINRIWRRIGLAQDYTRLQRKLKASAAASHGALAVDTGMSSAHEDEATAEKEAVLEYLRAKGILPPLESESGASAAAGGAGTTRTGTGSRTGAGAGDSDSELVPEDDAFEGEVERGRNGWLAFVTDDGFLYYDNQQTGETVWDRPADF